MKTIALSLGLILLTISFMGCEKENLNIVPSSQVTTRDHTFTDFDDLDISDPFQVYVQFSDTEQELRIEANNNLQSLIEVEQRNGELSIQLDDDIRRIEGTPVLKVYLTTRDIQSIKAQGAAQVYLQNHWYEDRAEVALTGASSLEGAVTAEHLTAELTGASKLTIQGSAHIFDIDATGASDMTSFDFETDGLTADLTGGCEVSLTVRDQLSVTASGGSRVYYRGQGVITYQNLSGGSEIIKE